MWTVKHFRMAGENYFRVYRITHGVYEVSAFGTFKTMQEASDLADKLNKEADSDEK